MRLSIPQMVLMSRLLDEALPLDEAGRQLWLENLAPEYQDLANALHQALLPGDAEAAEVEALAMLPILQYADPGTNSASRLQPGARVGPYELIRPLGTGGMAQVWLARRADGAFKREVALKLPLLSRLRPDLEQRFARERDILASLEHPHIARLYDAGIDGNSSPYLSMEYVQGQPLTDWCDAHRLAIQARLELFLQVHDAVQFAHEKQVIHRDLKPTPAMSWQFAASCCCSLPLAMQMRRWPRSGAPSTSIRWIRFRWRYWAWDCTSRTGVPRRGEPSSECGY